MFELLRQLSKHIFPEDEARGSSFFQYVLVGPLFLVATLSVVLFKLFVSSEWSLPWVWGSGLSLVLSFFIAALSFREARDFLSEKEACLVALQNALDEAKVCIEREKGEGFLRLKGVEEMARERLARMGALEALIAQRKYDWERLDQEKELLFQEKVDAEAKWQAALTKEKQKEAHHPYEEVRRQFEEKSLVLNETRKSLFLAESEALSLHKEREESALEPSATHDDLIGHLREVEIYAESLEAENRVMHDLVTHLSVKTPAKKVKVNEPLVADLIVKKPKKKKARKS